MKKLSLTLLLALLLAFLAIAAVQYWQQEVQLRKWLDQDFKKTGQMIFSDVLRREGAFWSERRRIVGQTASLFADLLAQSPIGTDATIQSPKGTVATNQPPKGTIATAQPEMPFHHR